MGRLCRISLALATGMISSLAAVASLVVGCAVGEQSGLGTDRSGNEPEVDASYQPRPAMPGPPAEDGDESSSSGTGGAPTPVKSPDAGAQSVLPTTPKPSQGEVLITEVLFDPSTPEPGTEWIEVYNASSGTRLLSGLTLVDGSGRSHTIGGGIEIAKGRYALLVRNTTAAVTAKVPSSAILYEYGTGADDSSGILLTNGTTGGIKLRDGSIDIAAASYGGWFSSPLGKSIQLSTLGFAAAASKTSWCLSANVWATGSDKGTPGAANDCP